GREPRRDRTDLPPPRRAAACDRARRRAREAPAAPGDPLAAHRAARPADGRRGRPARASTHAPGRDRLELQAARTVRADAARAARSLLWRLLARARGGR